jgi:hypothetical protein
MIERECILHIPVPNMTVEVDPLTGTQKVMCPFCGRNVAREVLRTGGPNRSSPRTAVDISPDSNGKG